ncbi:MAG: rhodanese-like domain-containing protein [Gemmatimonadaceae bacterium]|nr:rhodanese-like domain-containing protein [Gemmatimonadaceae bacterium]
MPSYRRKPVDLVIDVRSRLEFWLGHLDGAVCIPVGKLANAMSKRADIGKDARILVYCASGARSAIAASALTSLGYRRVTDAGAITQARQAYER